LRKIAILTVAFALAASTLSAAAKVIAVDVDGIVHPVTTEIVGSAIALAKQEDAVPRHRSPEHSRRPDGRHARNH